MTSHPRADEFLSWLSDAQKFHLAKIIANGAPLGDLNAMLSPVLEKLAETEKKKGMRYAKNNFGNVVEREAMKAR